MKLHHRLPSKSTNGMQLGLAMGPVLVVVLSQPSPISGHVLTHVLRDEVSLMTSDAFNIQEEAPFTALGDSESMITPEEVWTCVLMLTRCSLGVRQAMDPSSHAPRHASPANRQPFFEKSAP